MNVSASLKHRSAEDTEAELADMLAETGEHLTEDYLDVFFEIFDDLKIGHLHPPTPLEIIKGIGQAFANASGYRIVLQTELVRPVEGNPDTFRTVGYRDVAVAEPSLFGETVEE